MGRLAFLFVLREASAAKVRGRRKSSSDDLLRESQLRGISPYRDHDAVLDLADLPVVGIFAGQASGPRERFCEIVNPTEFDRFPSRELDLQTCMQQGDP